MATEQKSAMYPDWLAQKYASKVLERLLPHIELLEVCGSLRRGKSEVHDVDIVIKPSYGNGHDANTYTEALRNIKNTVSVMAMEDGQDVNKIMLGDKIIRFKLNVTESYDNMKLPTIPIDLYIAETKEMFDVLKLIRTGSAQHNVKLASTAKRNGMSLKASGAGLVLADGSVLTTEQDILTKLLGKYVPPADRN